MTPPKLECNAQVVAREVYTSCRDYMTHDIDEDWPRDNDPEYDEDMLHMI